jgi:Protein of unknown function (DUF2752)
VTSISYILSNPKRFRKIAGIAGAFLTLAVPYFIMLHSNGHIEEAQSLCPFKMLTGFPCPGCGITKSLIFLFEGDFLKSIYYHLFGPFAFLFCIAAIFVLSLELITQKEYFQSILFSKKFAYMLGATLAAYHFTRLIYFISTNSFDDILRESIWR